MAENCYPFTLPINVCVDGPVGGGSTAALTVQFVTSNDQGSIDDNGIAVGGGGIPKTIGTVPNWNGNLVTIVSWAPTNIGGCEVISHQVTVQLVNDNQVQVDLMMVVNNCEGGIYEDCGGPGPHTFMDTQILPMTSTACP